MGEKAGRKVKIIYFGGHGIEEDFSGSKFLGPKSCILEFHPKIHARTNKALARC